MSDVIPDQVIDAASAISAGIGAACLVIFVVVSAVRGVLRWKEKK